ncbi:MAG: SAM-dependent methyltransferase [Candidatus Tokpelaia sp.]|uniref:Eco57I restriction-modification methylase domain-containing protein n=1 Tax=Candidatus Tokpelaia sp. TaxID=2233777 RepID=UPI00123C01DE|nr:Eco57I restriction-modification methylase domain-containing protein [Candidatus Tokpelaia sp.]KAA6206418.1 MAG: SAM-dependent methyltransferase [Candidatus Tokpelaia sp.]KAA6207181.1 MAG: SAM-dependent methyltransferase [Candidatus Tokpelaia sp.]KAA6405933.1 SAM-dependent methyltransferase [Candidatus Tokpelaia sp.]
MLRRLYVTNKMRREVTQPIAPDRKLKFSQFMTPGNIASFMASLFPPSVLPKCCLLDAGAGFGALSCAFLDRWINGGFQFNSVAITAYEIDREIGHYLKQHLYAYDNVSTDIRLEDYIESATNKNIKLQKYTHVILNPPYKKISSNSSQRAALRRVGIEVVNLYSAFVALAVTETALNGQIVAIIPRSFCNGPYYRPFRKFILDRTVIRHIHLFESRDKIFEDDKVLQENIVIRLERCEQKKQEKVLISNSLDGNLTDMVTRECPVEQIIFPDDIEQFIRIPSVKGESITELPEAARYSLTDIGIRVSTGPVVDFRLKEQLCAMPETGTVPLIYPSHLGNISEIRWPNHRARKPNAIILNNDTRKWLYPNGFYCAVRRFSPKEEKRRIIASVINPEIFAGYPMLGFENHLNIFHADKCGLPRELAYGLAIFLNTTAIDRHFREFNGHTQVNVTDLKAINYPSRKILMQIGAWAIEKGTLTQEQIDTKVGFKFHE